MKNLLMTDDSADPIFDYVPNASGIQQELTDKLHVGVAHFFFEKKDKTIREAYGTLNKNLLTSILGEQEEKPEPQPPLTAPVNQTYYDLEAGAFRSFVIANLKALF